MVKRIGTYDKDLPVEQRPIRNPETRRIIEPGAATWAKYCQLASTPRAFKAMLIDEYGHSRKDARAIVKQWQYIAGLRDDIPEDPALPVARAPCDPDKVAYGSRSKSRKTKSKKTTKISHVSVRKGLSNVSKKKKQQQQRKKKVAALKFHEFDDDSDLIFPEDEEEEEERVVESKPKVSASQKSKSKSRRSVRSGVRRHHHRVYTRRYSLF